MVVVKDSPDAMTDEPYNREQLANAANTLPTRGPVCPKCQQHIPIFAELSDEDRHRILSLIRDGRKAMAMQELRSGTGCPLTWAKLWVQHEGQPAASGTTTPCPYCGQPLRTALAKQCRHCRMDWHEPANPKRLGHR